MRRRLVPWVLVVVGLALTTAWCVLVIPALFIAEAGAGLSLRDRALFAVPLVIGSALLILGGKRAGQPTGSAERATGLAHVVVMIGVFAGLGVVLFVLMPA